MIGLSKTRLRAILPEKINGGTEWITALLVNQCFPKPTKPGCPNLRHAIRRLQQSTEDFSRRTSRKIRLPILVTVVANTTVAACV